MDKYKDTIKKIYQKNIKKYKMIRKNNKILLIDKNSNSQVESVSIPEFKIISIEKRILEENIIKLNQKLIHLYLDIKNDPSLKNKYTNIYKTTLSKYSSALELLTSYNIYENIVNTKNMSDTTIDDTEKIENNKTTIFLPDLGTDIYDQSNVFIENHPYEIDNILIQTTQQINKEKTDLYYNINIALDDNDTEKEKNSNKVIDLIKVYLDNSNLKTVKNKIKVYE